MAPTKLAVPVTEPVEPILSPPVGAIPIPCPGACANATLVRDKANAKTNKNDKYFIKRLATYD